MADRLEDLANRLSADAEFTSLPQAEQDQVFATLAQEVEQPPIQLGQAQTIGAPRSLSLQDIFPQTMQHGNPGLLGQHLGRDVLSAVGAIPGTVNQIVGDAVQGRRSFNPLQTYQTELQGGVQYPTAEQQGMDMLRDTLTGMIPLSPVAQHVAKVGQNIASAIETAQLPKFVPKAERLARRVEEADSALTQASHQFVKRVRRRGDLHPKVSQLLHDESEAAWAPMKEVTAAIPDPISVQEVEAQLMANLADKPERLEAARLFLKEMNSGKEHHLPVSNRPFTGTAADWSDLSSELGTFQRKAALRGQVARDFLEVINTDLRSAISGIIKAKAPLEYSQHVDMALNSWADYATDRDALMSIFKVGASPQLETKAGTTFMRQAALGRLTPSQFEFTQRLLEKSGIDLPASIRPHAEALMKAKQAQQKFLQSKSAQRGAWNTLGYVGRRIIR